MGECTWRLDLKVWRSPAVTLDSPLVHKWRDSPYSTHHVAAVQYRATLVKASGTFGIHQKNLPAMELEDPV